MYIVCMYVYTYIYIYIYIYIYVRTAWEASATNRLAQAARGDLRRRLSPNDLPPRKAEQMPHKPKDMVT